MTDASSSAAVDESAASADGGTDAVDGGSDAFDDRPERPPSARLVDALGVVDHAKRGFAVGVVLAVAVFAFFVAIPALDPGTPTRPESPVLYLALAFVVAASGTLLVASALAVRAVAGRVMDYAKWTRRAAAVGAIGGLWWATTGVLALGVASGTIPESIRLVVLATLPLPVLVLAVGAWSALARTGGGRTLDADERVAADDFDHVLARPRRANAGVVLALVGVAVVHVATFLETDAFLAATAPAPGSALVLGTLALALGTVAVATALARTAALGVLATSTSDRTSIASVLTTSAAVLALASAGLVVVAALASTPALAPAGALVALGLAWTALCVAIHLQPGTYPERPI